MPLHSDLSLSPLMPSVPPFPVLSPLPPWVTASGTLCFIFTAQVVHRVHSTLPHGCRQLQEVLARNPVGGCLQDLPHHGGSAYAPPSLGAQKVPWPPAQPSAWASGPHGLSWCCAPAGSLSHHGGPAVHVVRDLPAPRLPGLLLWLPQAAV